MLRLLRCLSPASRSCVWFVLKAGWCEVHLRANATDSPANVPVEGESWSWIGSDGSPAGAFLSVRVRGRPVGTSAVVPLLLLYDQSLIDETASSVDVAGWLFSLQ